MRAEEGRGQEGLSSQSSRVRGRRKGAYHGSPESHALAMSFYSLLQLINAAAVTLVPGSHPFTSPLPCLSCRITQRTADTVLNVES